MLSRLFLILALSTVPLCAARANDAPPKPTELKFGFLKDWKGEIPEAESPDGGPNVRPALWDKHPEIKQAMEKTFGKARLDQLFKVLGSVATFVTGIDILHDTAGFYVCAKGSGECAHPTVYTFISMKDGSVQACWGDEKGDVWLGLPGGDKSMPKDACNNETYLSQPPPASAWRVYEELNGLKQNGK